MSAEQPLDRMLERLREVRERNGGYQALCPAHDDRNPSLSVTEGDDGRVLLRCHAGCSADDVVDAVGLQSRDLFPSRNGTGGEGRSTPSSTPARSHASDDKAHSHAENGRAEDGTRSAHGCTLGAYAEAKGLPLEFLGRLGGTQISYQNAPAVRIPYLGADGEEGCVRFRVSLSGETKVRTKKGHKVHPYGLGWLSRIREVGYVVLVEDESDAQTLWYYGIPALGIPGASTWRNDWAEDLEGVEKVYAVVEPDDGGEKLWERLAASPLAERLYRVELEGAKDVSELHLGDPDSFRERLDTALHGATAWLDIAESEAQEQARAAWASCEELASTPDILDRMADDLYRSGVAGERRVAKLLYLAVTSRLLDKPVSVAVKGPSSGGKSYLTEQVLRYLPDSAYYSLTAMSEHALAYSEEPLMHRFLVIYEASGMSSDFQSYLIRSLLSEGKVRYETVEKTSEGMRPKLIERAGPTGLLVTTTATRLHPENETRLLSLHVSDTRQQTADVLASLAAEHDGHEPDWDTWHALQTWLAHAEHWVAIPFASTLAGMVPPVAVRLRRDFGAVLNLIRAHTLLHQADRERDEQGRVIASITDYGAVRELVADLVAEGVEATVPPPVREVVEAVHKLHAAEGQPVTAAEIARHMKLDRSAASRRVRSGKDRGYLRDLEDNRYKPSRLVPGDDLPDDLTILPEPDYLLEACKRARVQEGVNLPPSPSNEPCTSGTRGEGDRTPP